MKSTKNRIMIGVLVSVSVLGLFLPALANAENLRVILNSVTPSKGDLVVLLVEGEDEWQKYMSGQASDGIRTLKEKAGVSKRQEFVFEGLTPASLQGGQYAIAAYQDTDRNGELRLGMFGIPQEPVGVSNAAAMSFGPPKYEDAKIRLKAGENTIEVTLR